MGMGEYVSDVCVYLSARKCIYIYIYICVCVCVCVCMCMYMYVHICIIFVMHMEIDKWNLSIYIKESSVTIRLTSLCGKTQFKTHFHFELVDESRQCQILQEFYFFLDNPIFSE